MARGALVGRFGDHRAARAGTAGIDRIQCGHCRATQHPFGTVAGPGGSTVMTMPRLRIRYLATLVVLVLAPVAGCVSGAGIAADTTCRDYLSKPTDARHAA